MDQRGWGRNQSARGARWRPRAWALAITVLFAAPIACWAIGRRAPATVMQMMPRVAGGDSARLLDRSPLPRRRPLGTSSVATRSAAPDQNIPVESERGGERVSGHVLDATGGAIAGAWVTAKTPGPRLAAGISKEDGGFELYLPPGAHQVRARADGYAEATRDVWAPSSGVAFTLAPAASLAGRVIVKGTEAPVAGVEVRAVNTNAVSTRPDAVQSGVDGGFNLHGLAAGDYSLSAIGEQWRSDELSVTLGVNQLGGPVTLEVVPATTLTGSVSVASSPCRDGWVHLSGPVSSSGAVGADGGVRLEGLLPGSYRADVHCEPGVSQSEELVVAEAPLTRSWDLDAGSSVEGRVETTLGEPVEGVEVHVTATAEGPEGSSARCTTDSTGEFRCSGLRAGEHDCWVAGHFSTAEAAARINLTTGETPWVRLQSSGVGTLRVALGRTGSGDLASMSLVARRAGAPPVQARLSADGFIFEGLTLGQYGVFFEPSPEAAATVTLSRAGQVIDLTLDEPSRTSISGTVVDELGAPVVDAWVRAIASRFDSNGSAHGATAALTDELGAFTLGGLISGEYDLQVDAPSGRTRLRGVETGGPDRVVRLETRASVRVQVITDDHQPVQRFTLAYRRRGGTSRTVIEGNGGVWSTAGLEPGSYTLTVTSEQGSASRELDVPPAGDIEISLQVSPSPLASEAHEVAAPGL